MTLAKPCIEPGCGHITVNGSRCPAHQRIRDRLVEERRGTAAERGYGPAWQRLSRAVIARDLGICHICGQPGATTVDHLVPKVLGGTDDERNLRAAHRACNAAKGGRLS